MTILIAATALTAAACSRQKSETVLCSCLGKEKNERPTAELNHIEIEDAARKMLIRQIHSRTDQVPDRGCANVICGKRQQRRSDRSCRDARRILELKS